MQEATVNMISQALRADTTVSAEVKRRIRRACKGQSMTPAEFREYMRPADFARKTGLKRSTVYQFIKVGLPSIHVNQKCILIDPAEATEWLERHAR